RRAGEAAERWREAREVAVENPVPVPLVQDQVRVRRGVRPQRERRSRRAEEQVVGPGVPATWQLKIRFERKRPKRVSTIAGPAACHLATKAASPASGVRAAAGTGSEAVCANASATSWPKAESEASVPAKAVVPLRNVRRPNA